MNDHIDIDQLLNSALGSVQIDSGARPHLADVRHRARRMHRRRTAGVVGAFAVLGAAGVGAQALRHDNHANLQPGDGLGGAVSGSALPPSDCYNVAPGSVPVPTVSTIILDTFVVGDTIAIPESPTTSYPTDTVSVSTGPGLYPAVDTTLPCDSTAPTAPTVLVSVVTTVQTFENQVTTTYFGQEAPPASPLVVDGPDPSTTTMG